MGDTPLLPPPTTTTTTTAVHCLTQPRELFWCSRRQYQNATRYWCRCHNNPLHSFMIHVSNLSLLVPPADHLVPKSCRSWPPAWVKQTAAGPGQDAGGGAPDEIVLARAIFSATSTPSTPTVGPRLSNDGRADRTCRRKTDCPSRSKVSNQRKSGIVRFASST